MKKICIPTKSGLITLWVLCLLYQHAQAQTPSACTGIWEGNFMEQFKTVILLDQQDQSAYVGKIMMYSGALFIGEEPGSTYMCNDFSIQYELPNTGMEVNIPRTTFVTNVSGFEEGKPFPVDYELNISIVDLLKGEDCYTSSVDKMVSKKTF